MIQYIRLRPRRPLRWPLIACHPYPRQACAYMTYSSPSDYRDISTISRQRCSANLPEEAEDPSPGVLGCVGELVLLAVEERMRRARVGHDLVLDAGLGKCLLERRHLLGRDRLVGAAEETEDRPTHLPRDFDRRLQAPA